MSLNRRRFLQLATAVTAGTMFDPERLLWVPGAKTYFIPDTTLVTAQTMAEALSVGLRARVPWQGGWMDMDLRVAGQKVDAEIASIVAMGGYVVERRTYRPVDMTIQRTGRS